jgi:ABC-type uncharacterized transport system substrate-binding protein
LATRFRGTRSHSRIGEGFGRSIARRVSATCNANSALVDRRAFIRCVLAACAFGPAALVDAQRPGVPVIGFLNTISPEGAGYLVAAFRQGLREAGYVEGKNVAIEFRWGPRRSEQLAAMAAELVRRRVAVIAASGGSEARLAAKQATATIPIVFAMGGDPVREGLVTSLNRPGGNVTGVSFLNTLMEAKRLGVLHEIVAPSLAIAVLIDPNIVSHESQTYDVQQAARTLARQVYVLNARNEREIDAALATLAQVRAGGLLVAASPLYNRVRRSLVERIAAAGIPAVYESREYTEAGGLVSYGASVADAYRQMGSYVGKILDGAKPSELPILQSTKYELVINLVTAKRLGMKIPQSLLLVADDVIR